MSPPFACPTEKKRNITHKAHMGQCNGRERVLEEHKQVKKRTEKKGIEPEKEGGSRCLVPE